jgi:hypothetical protein
MQEDITIFISYAHEDERLCTKLRKYLHSLERVRDVKVWSDRTIRGGEEWEHRINFYLNTAQIILLLISRAMDLFHQEGIKYFCIVAGDSDYVPLVLRLRQGGSTVLVIGPPACSSVLKEASSVFLSTDQLLPQPSSQPSSSKAIPPLSPLELSMLLTKAYDVASRKSETEWVLLAALGSALRQLNPHFQVIFRKQKLSTVIKQHPTLFEIRHRVSGNGQVGEVRLLNST